MKALPHSGVTVLSWHPQHARAFTCSQWTVGVRQRRYQITDMINQSNGTPLLKHWKTYQLIGRCTVWIACRLIESPRKEEHETWTTGTCLPRYFEEGDGCLLCVQVSTHLGTCLGTYSNAIKTSSRERMALVGIW
jgi:hypothetical protein